MKLEDIIVEFCLLNVLHHDNGYLSTRWSKVVIGCYFYESCVTSYYYYYCNLNPLVILFDLVLGLHNFKTDWLGLHNYLYTQFFFFCVLSMWNFLFLARVSLRNHSVCSLLFVNISSKLICMNFEQHFVMYFLIKLI